MVQWAPFCCQEIKVVIKLVYYLDKKIFRNKFRPDLAVVGCRASTDTFLSLACFEIKGNPQKKKISLLKAFSLVLIFLKIIIYRKII